MFKNLPPDLLLEIDYTLKALPVDNKYITLREDFIDKFIVKKMTTLMNFFPRHTKLSEFLQFLQMERFYRAQENFEYIVQAPSALHLRVIRF